MQLPPPRPRARHDNFASLFTEPSSGSAPLVASVRLHLYMARPGRSEVGVPDRRGRYRRAQVGQLSRLCSSSVRAEVPQSCGSRLWCSSSQCQELSQSSRLHLDLRADGISTDEELNRLLDLGASPVDVGQSPEANWVVLADLEGNEFCLLSTSVQDLVR